MALTPAYLRRRECAPTIKRLGEECEAEGEEEHVKVDADFMNTGKAGGCGGDEGFECGGGQAETDEAAGEANDEAFKEEFAGGAFPWCSESGADGEFLAAAFDADEQEVGDIGAGDEQDHGDGTHEDPEDFVYIADDIFLEGAQVGRDAGFVEDGGAETLGRGKTAEGDGEEARHVGAGLLEGCAGLEASEGALTEVAEFDLAAVPLEGHDDGRVGIHRGSGSRGGGRR